MNKRTLNNEDKTVNWIIDVPHQKTIINIEEFQLLLTSRDKCFHYNLPLLFTIIFFLNIYSILVLFYTLQNSESLNMIQKSAIQE